jgi:phosphoserine phosphatase RsbU/P
MVEPRERNESALRSDIDHAACGLLTTEASGLILRANRTFCDWLGMSAEELVGSKRLQDLLTIGCKIFHQTHWMPLMQMQGSVAEVQLDLVHREGQTLPALVNAQKAMEDGRVVHHVAVIVATDRRKYERELLTARKRAEQLLESEREAREAQRLAEAQLRLAIESAHLLVWTVDLATNEPVYADGVRELIGLPDHVPLSAEAYRACIHDEDRERERASFEAAMSAGGNGQYAVEYRIRSHRGDERVVSSSGRAFVDMTGQIVRFSGVIQDVSAWRAAERVLRDQERESRARAVTAEQLVGIVSHDLRTPINAIQLGAVALRRGDLTRGQLDKVERIIGSSQRATRLLGDLLDFTQARLAGGLRISRSSFDGHALTRDCVEELRVAWPGGELRHDTYGSGACDADPDRVAQLVTNLANNALTYGAREHAVTITSRVDSGTLTLAVHNDGAPIPAELLAHIFEPLRRGEQQLSSSGRSVGLGLYIVQQIAAAHGGTVDVRSTEELGTTFTVTLPARRDHEGSA